MFAHISPTRTICKPRLLALALCGLMLLAPAPAWAQAKDVKCNGCVNGTDIADETVESVDIRNGTISADDIGTGAVNSAKIADHTVTSNDIAPGAVTNAGLAPDAVQGGNIANGSVTAADLAPGVLDIHAVGDSGSIVIPAAAFQPENETTYYDLSPGGYIRPGATDTNICVQAAVLLPNAVTVTQLEGIFWDNTDAQTVGVGLNRVSIVGPASGGAFDTGCWDVTPDFSYCTQPTYTSNQGAVDEMATAATSALGPLPGIVVVAHAINPGTEVVNTEAFAYFLHTCFTSDGSSADNTRLYGARIRYN